MKAEEIKKIRESLKMTRKEFAIELGVSKHTVTSWELGRRSPGEPTKKVIRALSK